MGDELDVVVIGAGVAGLATLHLLRGQGLRVRAYDAADDVGGSWWWHGYPGSRLDTEGASYQYSFSEDLVRDWGWSERFPAGYEVLRWLRFVADRLDLRRDIVLGTPVVAAAFDEERARWTVRTGHGETVEARFVVACTGLIPGPAEALELDGFAGTVVRTSRWPEKSLDLGGRRVGVLGSGTPAVQLVPRIAAETAHLTLFAREPVAVVPRVNTMYGWQERDAYRSRFAERRATLPHTVTGGEDGHRAGDPAGLYADGSRRLWFGGPPDAAVAGYVRAAMTARLDDPALAAVLVPADDDAPMALDAGYLEAFGRADVTLVDLRADPVAAVRAGGLELASGAVHEIDVLVLTEEPDAGPPALADVDVRGRDGRALADAPETVLGLGVPGFPNLFTTAAAPAPTSARAVMTTVRQHQAEWITRAIRDLDAAGGSTIEAVAADGAAVDGVGDYVARCEAETAAGYPSFRRG
ncbi:NAD(P)/FAD-dependent oxidoreductase [Actinomycetospora lutea]|uniref:flavin-containing monooxygenase n=1 Tax=Actinomycetospora lutea TaxID=663604 RepID=UPI0023662573|nr:NAD(P)/FAD-dependent oxidoreductase [Actinomycetospora lutea]MDD7938351.1 NAD(P)/FAD-dependent oxidoreductase [Actinomycetospora lutea]